MKGDRSAFAVLVGLVAGAFAGAVAGLAGGIGGRWLMLARILDLERGFEGLDRRMKGREGQAGQEARRANQRTALSMEEELKLRAAAERSARGKPALVPDADGIVPLSPQELARVRAIADAEAKAKGA